MLSLSFNLASAAAGRHAAVKARTLISLAGRFFPQASALIAQPRTGALHGRVAAFN